MMKKDLEIRVGVVGYCPPSKFDEKEAEKMLNEAFDKIKARFPGRKITIVSGLTNVGVPAIAYRLASEKGYKTEGVACKKAEDFEIYPVDKKIIVGNDWGEESETFLKESEVLIRVGGGKQSFKEAAEAKKQGKWVLNYNLTKE